MLNHEQQVNLAKRWIKSKGCTLWMEWDVSNEDSLQEAGEWMITAMDQFMDFYESELEDGSGW